MYIFIYVCIYVYIYIYKYKYKCLHSLFCLYRNKHVLRALLQLAENANPCEAIGHSMVPFQSLYRKLIYTWGHAVQGHGLNSAAHSPFAPIFLHRCCYGLHVGQTTYTWPFMVTRVYLMGFPMAFMWAFHASRPGRRMPSYDELLHVGQPVRMPRHLGQP